MSTFILPLSDPEATLETVGGKGMSLARLARAGLPVPGGFHVNTDAYRRFVADNGFQPLILAALQGADTAQPASLDAVSQGIGKLFATASIPAEITTAISTAYAKMNDAAVAVRSSATAEDLPEASFAGQQDTYLNIHGEAAVLDAIKRCWASLWTARAIGYRLKNGIDQKSVALAVVVQELVPADAAGVMFTANPLNGRRDQAVINAAWGLGEAIVSGTVTPDMMTVDKLAGHPLQRETASKQVMTIQTETGTSEQPVPVSKQNAPVLSDEQISELTSYGVRIESFYKMPMDIEWALAGDKFAILQARPITALPDEQTEPPTEWKLPNPKGVYFRASIIEQLPEPLSPLFATLGGSIIGEATRRLFNTMAGGKGINQKIRLFDTINGYGYINGDFGFWNMVRAALSQVFKINWMFKQSEPRWRQAHDHYIETIRHWQAKPVEDYTAVDLLDGVRALFGETMEVYTVLQIGPIATALATETLFTQLYNRLIKKKDDPDASVFLTGFESMPIRAEFALFDLAEWARISDGLADHLTTTPATQLAAELENHNPPPGVNPETWEEWRRRFQEHLAKYGHFTYDLDFAKSVAADDPAPLLETCRMYLMGKAGNPYERVKVLAGRREQAKETILKRLHRPMRKIFCQQLQSAQDRAPLREDGLSDLGLGYPLLRKMLLEFGNRLVRTKAFEQPEDVFWLREQEINQVASALDQGQPLSSLASIIENRRAAWKAEQHLSPPMILPIGAKYFGMNVEKLMSSGPADDPHVIKGFGSSKGKVTAPARVLLGPQDFGQMQPGDVLVAPLTTPAWTPLFAMASAIVTDIGGPLSHSSIVAREYGIPAVLGTGIATRRIHSGQIITVDGDAGTVNCQ